MHRCHQKETNYFCQNSKLERLNQRDDDSCRTQIIHCLHHKFRVMMEIKVCFQLLILLYLEIKVRKVKFFYNVACVYLGIPSYINWFNIILHYFVFDHFEGYAFAATQTTTCTSIFEIGKSRGSWKFLNKKDPIEYDRYYTYSMVILSKNQFYLPSNIITLSSVRTYMICIY